MEQNEIINIDYLANLINLSTLDLSSNQINNISVLSHLKNLKYILLNWNHIEFIDSLHGLSHLKVINLAHNQIRDISGIGGLRSVTKVYLQSNLIDLNIFIDIFQEMSKLEILNLTKNSEINQFINISNLYYLRRVYFDSRQIEHSNFNLMANELYNYRVVNQKLDFK